MDAPREKSVGEKILEFECRITQYLDENVEDKSCKCGAPFDSGNYEHTKKLLRIAADVFDITLWEPIDV